MRDGVQPCLGLSKSAHSKNIQQDWTASVRESSRYSLYMLWVPDRELYLNQMPKFLTLPGFFSKIYSSEFIKTHLIDRHDFSRSFLDLVHLLQEIPKARLGNHVRGSKETHSVEFGSGLLFGGESTSNHLVL